ncbi:M61 family metallopeptidase [Thermithiobacillus plumbiphilus]|uniref:PDZ domain-containing protein n=1 Tax=Thermithiobacillus plumbiphilus TaxID=1729899 RepID=A0ABU9D750_9PROT
MSQASPIAYQIVPKNLGAHLFEVSCTVADPNPAGQCFSLPAWVPGSYLIREFARHIVRLKASADGRPLGVRKIDKDTWCCEPTSASITLTYEVYAFDLSVRAAYLDNTRGYFNGSSVFLRPHGLEDRVCALEICPPAGTAFQDWRVGTSMARDGAPAYGFGRYRAANYDELIDHPVEMAPFTLAQFTACGVPHDIIITGRHRADLDRLCRDLKTICEYQIRLFGEPAPMDRYVFLVLAVGDGYGGLEHRASTSLICKRDNLPQMVPAGLDQDPNDPNSNEGYRSFLGLCSHEYFHTWNVKRIKPAAFTPYDLAREAYTTQLWAFEGITSYYDDLVLRRSGLISPETYLEMLGETATRVWRGSGRLKQSVAESSFDAWTKFYRQDENAPNAVVSYYAKGSLVALALDLLLRSRTGGKHSLDDLMRLLWQRYGQAATGIPEGGIEAAAEELSGLDLRDFFAQAVYGTEELPFAELLAPFGIQFQLRQAESDKDSGGKPAKDKSGRSRSVLGARIASGEEARLIQVFDEGPAQQAGLAADDVVIAVDGLRVSGRNLTDVIAGHVPGSRVQVHAFRRDELMVFDLTLAGASLDTCVLTLDAEASPEQVKAREAWLEPL